jgi:hypothetical protein
VDADVVLQVVAIILQLTQIDIQIFILTGLRDAGVQALKEQVLTLLVLETKIGLEERVA